MNDAWIVSYDVPYTPKTARKWREWSKLLRAAGVERYYASESAAKRAVEAVRGALPEELAAIVCVSGVVFA